MRWGWLVLLLGLTGQVEARNVAVKTTGFSILFLGCWHIGDRDLDTSDPTPVVTWAQTTGPDLRAICIAGDVTVSGTTQGDYSSWLGTSVDTPVYFCLGNHETDFYSDSSDTLMGVGDSPYTTAFGYAPWLHDRGYGLVEILGVRVLLMNSLADTTVDVGTENYVNAYRADNPPGRKPLGANDPNPCWGGIIDTTSAQCTWAASEFTNYPSSWVIPVMHRPSYPPYTNATLVRPVLRSTRDGIMAKLTRLGMDVCYQADVHVAGVTYPIYKSPQTHLVTLDPLGTVYATLTGGYAARPIETAPSDLPENSFQYAGVDGASELRVAYGMLMTFYGDLAWCQLYRYDIDGASGSVVWSGQINREGN